MVITKVAKLTKIYSKIYNKNKINNSSNLINNKFNKIKRNL